MYNGCVKILGFLVFSASLVSCLALSSSASATDPSSSATATVHVSEACSLTSTVITPHTDNMGNGTYTDSLGSTKFTVKCNDASGFALYAIGYSGDEYGATSMLGDNELSIPTGTDASAGNTTSHWSMKISKDTTSYLPNSLTIENSFNSQHIIPSTYTKIASFPSSTDGTNGTGTSILATYGVRVSGTQAAGTYIGKVKYTLVHPNMVNDENRPVIPITAEDCLGGWVCYAPNSEDIIGSMDSLSSTKITSSPKAGKINVGTSVAEITLIAPNYSRPGYGFAGWSTKWDATTATNPIIYGPNETITVADLSTNEEITFSSQGLILYPVWIASTGNLQDWSCSNSNLTQAPTSGRATLTSMTALKDTRDNNVYAVAKLADGKCWMVENLRLNAENSRGDANIAKAQGYGDATNSTYGNLGKFIGLANSQDAYFDESMPIVANSHYSADGSNDTVSINNISRYYPAHRMPRYNNNNTNMANNATNSDNSTLLTDSYNGSGNNLRWFGYGNYYSWAAAIANTEYYTARSSSDEAGTSICPKGWKLPLGYVSSGDIDQGESNNYNRVGGFSYLDRKLGGTGSEQSSSAGIAQSKKWRSFPNNFVYSGYYGGTLASGRGSRGNYWSSSARNSTDSYPFNIANNNYVNPGNLSSNKINGISVRCIAQ